MGELGVVVITHTAKHHLPFCLPPLFRSRLKPKILVVNSSSNDGTVEKAKEMGAETLVIPRCEFNHGATRELARKHLDSKIVVFLTPDAYAVDEKMLERLIDPLIQEKASVSYARQLPQEGAGVFEAFLREFNYPQEPQLRGIEDVETYGVYTFFCSNSCAAYSSHDLDTIGGFQPVLLGEDTVAVAKLLHKGYKIAYTPDAVVKHSHPYSLLQEFQRHFDTGLSRTSYRNLLDCCGSDTKRGREYIVSLIKRLSRTSPQLLPYAFLKILAKWSGYRFGTLCENAPLWCKRACTSQDFYWDSIYYKRADLKSEILK